MQCINDKCDSTETKVVETTNTLNSIHRRRACPVCNERYVTVEVLAPKQVVPSKKSKK